MEEENRNAWSKYFEARKEADNYKRFKSEFERYLSEEEKMRSQIKSMNVKKLKLKEVYGKILI